MKKLHPLAVCVLMAPAIALGAGSAYAQESSTTQDRTQEQPVTQGQPHSSTMPSQAQKDKGMATASSAQEQRMATQGAHKNVKAVSTYLSSQPANSLRADELIGSDLKSSPDSETVGSISDLLIDKNGHILAAIVEVGGFLGMGEKEVAISWDSVEHSKTEDGNAYEFTVNATRDALTNAPEYKYKAGTY